MTAGSRFESAQTKAFFFFFLLFVQGAESIYFFSFRPRRGSRMQCRVHDYVQLVISNSGMYESQLWTLQCCASTFRSNWNVCPSVIANGSMDQRHWCHTLRVSRKIKIDILLGCRFAKKNCRRMPVTGGLYSNRTDISITSIAESCPLLKCLKIDCTKHTDASLLARYREAIAHLKLGGCKRVTDTGIRQMITQLTHLRSLHKQLYVLITEDLFDNPPWKDDKVDCQKQ
jgi:hypothetical protein